MDVKCRKQCTVGPRGPGSWKVTHTFLPLSGVSMVPHFRLSPWMVPFSLSCHRALFSAEQNTEGRDLASWVQERGTHNAPFTPADPGMLPLSSGSCVLSYKSKTIPMIEGHKEKQYHEFSTWSLAGLLIS